jgi:transcription-repair coupling factor (superfamily II helicase)
MGKIMEAILQRLSKHPAIEAYGRHEERFSNVSLAQEALLVASYYKKHEQSLIIVKSNLFQAQQLFEKVAALLNYPNEVFLYAQEESLRVEAIASSPQMHTLKMEAMMKLLTVKNPLCITHTAAVIRKIPTKETLINLVMELHQGENNPPANIINKLREMGYTQVNRVDQPLTFAVRGGIIDIYAINYDQPIRIEFYDTEIESIRSFDIHTQRTIENVNSIRIPFATDVIFTEESIRQIELKIEKKLEASATGRDTMELASLREVIDQDLSYIRKFIKEPRLYRYLGLSDDVGSMLDLCKAKIVVSSIEEVKQQQHHIVSDTVEYIQELAQDHRALAAFDVFFDAMTVLAPKNPLFFHQFDVKDEIKLSWHAISKMNQPLPQLSQKIKQQSETMDVVLILQESEIRLMIEQFINQDIPYQISDGKNISSGITIIHGQYDEGFEAISEKLIVYTSKELFSTTVRLGRFVNRFKEAEVLGNYSELATGDYVVHQQHGIGKYMGLTTQLIDGVHKDFLHISYRGDDVLYVPLEQFRLVRKFVSGEGASPKLNKLGSSEWSKTKKRLNENIAELADRLIALYASRSEHIGYAYKEDTDMQREFENEFEYELTDDQKQAIIEIKEDMMKAKPMDRLLCGDVGFGKTEVAIRAAFKAVSENKQVAFLCPTTVLSRQHYQTFLKRFKNYPINIAVLNRFVIESKQKEILRDLAIGKIDILIGTHRILSKDVKFKDLGFLIIDEEQRFGVEHKEKIKELRNSIDVLSLSATPIPRTLQMSLIGLRSLSQLNTPPSNRLPVQTYIVEKNRSLIKEIIERELARGGQVFYLFNNVEQIFSLAYRLQQDIPYAKVAVAHGQMNREEIEDVMFQFTENQCNVMVCTTIIETGIDIPNANTMIIDKADTFGLSQLYQIKGRVGRSDRLAYAYLMYEPKKQLSEVASKRLGAIKEFTELGSGYKIAMRDLTIRGAGDLLGPDQSGFIDTVGIDMYIEMLQKAIAEKQGIIAESEPEALPKVMMKIDAYIPKNFAPEDLEKINMYKRVDAIRTLKGLNELIDEVSDVYGHLPAVVSLLFEKKRLEILLSEERIHSFKEHATAVELVFTKDYSDSMDGVALFTLVNQVSRDIELKYIQRRIVLKFKKHPKWLAEVTQVLMQTKKLKKKNS